MENEFRASDTPTSATVFRQLIYVSTTARSQSDSDMSALLAQCRRDNAAQNITGMLLYKDGHFMQVIEGPPDIIGTLYQRICRDPRHRDQITVLDRIGTGRDFPDWSMGYRCLDAAESPGAGFNDVLLTTEEPGKEAPLPIRFLKRFAENIRD